ncbi:MAG: hypothetical protein SFX72_05730 [Isosphaeraceae bacterium]|nr:hypothetical protein [Isosphaeraceae bacterium]
MHIPRSRSRRLLGLVVVVGMSVWIAETRADDPLAAATAALDAGDPRRAVGLLEDALVQPSIDRKRAVDLLRRAYEAAADRSRRDGRIDEAEEFLENRRILDRAPESPPASTAAPESPRPQAVERPAPIPAPDPLPPRDEAVKPATNPAPPETGAAVEPPSDPRTAPAAEPRPEPGPDAPSVAKADALFIAKDYIAAGTIYAALAKVDKLPANRREHWGYCRASVVASRISAKPASEAEWREIHEEIERIRRLSPTSWVAGYLRNLAEERSRRPAADFVAPAQPRGAQPPSDQFAIEQPLPPVAALPAAPRRPPAKPVALPGSDLPGGEPPAPTATGSWRILESTNFRIYHEDDALARQVAEAAERARSTYAQRWGGSPPARWNPACDIYLFPTADAFAAATKQTPDSPGFSTIGMNQGKVVQRLVNLRVDHPGIVDVVLPHEITHVVLADFFLEQQVPRWADEGIAVLSEPAAEVEKRLHDLDQPLQSGRLFKLADLMKMDYPEGPDWPLYYAQSVSVTRHLVEKGGPARFIDFLQGVQRRGLERELKRVYGVTSIEALQAEWLAAARERAKSSARSSD